MDGQTRWEDVPWAGLFSVTLAFFAATACWTLFAVSGVYLKTSMALNQSSFGSLLAIPLLSGAGVAVVTGPLSARLGPRRVIVCGLIGLMVTLSLMLTVSSFQIYWVVAVGLGLTAGVFVAGLHLVSRLCGADNAGLCLGVVAAGLTGAGFSYLLVPMIHAAYQWQWVPIAHLALLGLVLLLFIMMTEAGVSAERECFRTPAIRRLPASILRLCVHYLFLFGAVVALSLWLPDYLAGRFALPLDQAGRLSLFFVLPAAFGQILGGALADRTDAEPIHRVTLIYSACLLFLLSYPSMSLTIDRSGIAPFSLSIDLPVSLMATALLGLGMLLGVGQGSQLRLLFDLAGERMPQIVGLMIGAGCLGAATLPFLFGVITDLTGIRSSAFMLLFVLAAVSVATFEYELYRRSNTPL